MPFRSKNDFQSYISYIKMFLRQKEEEEENNVFR